MITLINRGVAATAAFARKVASGKLYSVKLASALLVVMGASVMLTTGVEEAAAQSGGSVQVGHSDGNGGGFNVGVGYGTGGGGYGGGYGGASGDPGRGVAQGDYRIHNVTQRMFELLEGNLGALIMVSAGLLAVVSAAFGAYRAAVGLLAVAVGAFVLRSLVTIFFNFE